MKIHLDETELKTAITQYIDNEGLDLSQKDLDIQLTAGRGANGHYADVIIVPKGTLIEKAELPLDDNEEEETPFDLDPVETEPGDNEPAIDLPFEVEDDA